LIQDAINYAEANMNPSAGSPVLIYIMPCITTESIQIKKSGVNLQGIGGQGACRIKTNSGVNTRPALTITNATVSSVSSFYANDGRNNPSGAYTNLVADVTFPTSVQIRDIEFGDPNVTGVNDIMILGTGNGVAFLSSEANLMRVTCLGNFFAKNANYITLQDNTYVKGTITTQNIAKLTGNFCLVDGTIQMSYNAASTQPSDGSNMGLNGNMIKIKGSLFLYGSAQSGIDGLYNIMISGNLDLDNTANCKIDSGYITGNITTEGTATFTLRNVFVEGNVTLSDVEGTTPCVMDGGNIIGLLSDTSSRLIWHDYNPANAADWNGTPPRTIHEAIDRLAAKVATGLSPA